MNAEHNGPTKIEEEIDATLKMLGETQPPAEIVLRVHRRLESAVSQRVQSSRRFLIPAVGVAMATVVLVLAVLTQTRRTQVNQASAVGGAKLVATVPPAQATIMPPSPAAEAERSDEGKQLLQYSTKRRSRSNRENRRAANFLSYPLTRQEKLLVRFVQTAKPADLQALNPEYQAKVEAQQEAEFAAYLKSGSDSSTKETAN
jgi:hypothetical protein